MNITKKILKKLTLKIIADDKTIVNNQKLKELVKKNSQVLSQLGMKKNNNVVIVLNNSLEFVISFLSTVNVCISAPLNPNYTEGEFNFYFSDLKPKLIVTNFENDHAAILCAKKFKIKILNIKNYIFQTNSKKNVKNILSSGLNDTALVLHTSGTTSKPKMVPLTHSNIINSALNISTSLRLSRKDKNIILMPSFHIHGIVASILAPLVSGGKIVVLPKFNALSFYKSLATHSPSWFTGVPTMLQSILDRSEKNSKIINNHKLRFIRSSSASLPTATLKKLEKLFKVPVIESYGMTEASHQMTSNLLPPRKRKVGSVGVPEGIKVKVINENHKKSKDYEVGEILVKGRSIFKKYIASKKINSDSFNNGWFRTGDLGYFDEDGYLFISGRIKEIINRGGEKISPKEVDEVFMNYKKVNKAVSFSIDHPKLGEDIGLAIVLNKNVKCTSSELKIFAQDKLAQYKIPKKIIFLKEIPLGATGKIQRIGLAKKLGVK